MFVPRCPNQIRMENHSVEGGDLDSRDGGRQDRDRHRHFPARDERRHDERRQTLEQDGPEAENSNVSGNGVALGEKLLWRKVAKFAKKAGRELINAVLVLFCCFKHPDTPPRVRVLIVAALAYFILPIDLIADPLPLLGLTDDLAVLILAWRKAAEHVMPKCTAWAAENLEKWFR